MLHQRPCKDVYVTLESLLVPPKFYCCLFESERTILASQKWSLAQTVIASCSYF
jgi:hypothetical protein